MYRKSYVHLSSCMMTDEGNLFQFTYSCNNDKTFFERMSNGREIKETYDQYGFPAQKVYQGSKHIMTFDMSQSILFSSVEIKDDFVKPYINTNKK